MQEYGHKEHHRPFGPIIKLVEDLWGLEICLDLSGKIVFVREARGYVQILWKWARSGSFPGFWSGKALEVRGFVFEFA